MAQSKSKPLIIGICGPLGAGKTTLANILKQETGGKIYSFSMPLKEYAKSLGWDGKKDAKGRKLLQLLGTDCARELISEWVWVDKLDDIIGEDSNHVVYIDDVRFINEADYVKKNGGLIIQVKGRRRGKPSTWISNIVYWLKTILGLRHKSERPIPKSMVDFVIDNSKDDYKYLKEQACEFRRSL